MEGIDVITDRIADRRHGWNGSEVRLRGGGCDRGSGAGDWRGGGGGRLVYFVALVGWWFAVIGSRFQGTFGGRVVVAHVDDPSSQFTIINATDLQFGLGLLRLCSGSEGDESDGR